MGLPKHIHSGKGGPFCYCCFPSKNSAHGKRERRKLVRTGRRREALEHFRNEEMAEIDDWRDTRHEWQDPDDPWPYGKDLGPFGEAGEYDLMDYGVMEDPFDLSEQAFEEDSQGIDWEERRMVEREQMDQHFWDLLMEDP